MPEELYKWFSIHYRTLFIIMACCSFVVFTTVLACKKYFHWEGRVSSIEGECKKIDDRIDYQFAKIDDRFARIDYLFAKIDDRFAKIDDRFAKIDDQLMQLNNSINILNGNFNSLIVYLKGKDDKMDTSLFV